MKRFKNHIAEDLRKWFGKGKEGGAGGGGWDRYNSEGERVGKCGGADEGDAYAACLSKEKAQKLGKKGIASFVRRKRAAQKKGGDAKKGGEQSKGDKPIFVKTKANEDWSDKYKDSIDCDNPKGFSQKAHCAGRKKQNEGLRQAMSGPRETPAQKRKRKEKDNFDLYKKRQKRAAALRGDPSSRKLTRGQEKHYQQTVNLRGIRGESFVRFKNFKVNEDCGCGDPVITEAEYQGKKVKLNDPIRTSEVPTKKFKVYVKDGDKVKVVRFGDPNMEIKRDDPERIKSFRARHNCDNPGPKTKARYWSCYQWRRGAKVDN